MLKQNSNRLDKLQAKLLARYNLVFDAFLPTLSAAELDRVIALKGFISGRAHLKPGPNEVLDWQINVKYCAAIEKAWGTYPKDYIKPVKSAEDELKIVPEPGDTVLTRVKRIAQYLEVHHAEF